MRINFDFADLEAFLAVMETGSFHAASQRLGLSQPSVTRRVQKLEESLASTLFNRTTRTVKPTLAAKRLKERAEAMLDDARETARAMRDETEAFAFQRARTVTLATIPTVIPHLVVPAIRRFRTERRDARIRLLDLAANEVAEAVSQGEADIGICSIPMQDPMLEFDLLHTDPIVLALRPDHPLAKRDALTWSDLRDEALILPSKGTGNRLLIDDALAHSKIPPSWTYEVGRSTTALDLVAGGIGVAPVPQSSLAQYPGHGVTHRQVTGPRILRPVGLLTRIGQKKGAAVADLVQAIRSVARD